MQIITQAQLKKTITNVAAIAAIEQAYTDYSAGKILMPDPFVFDLPNDNGEICIKTAVSPEIQTYSIKLVSVFKSNQTKGLPTLNGTINVFDASTGQCLAIIDEQGWLTNLRTACAGAIADKYFKLRDARTLGIIGAGAQALNQCQLILDQNQQYKKVIIWNRSIDRAQTMQQELTKLFTEVDFQVIAKLENLTSVADTILTATPATEPILHAELINKPVTIIGIGADMPNKCEIAPELYKKADKVYVDSLQSNRLLGGIARGLKQKIITDNDITGEIGQVISQEVPGRKSNNELIIVKSVGIGAQDTYIGNLAYQKTQ